MDPYLEAPERWSGVHSRLIAVLGELLTRQVAPHYFVDSEDHVYIIAPDDLARPLLVRPDLYVLETATAQPAQRGRGRIAAPQVIELPESWEVRYPYLEVRDAANREVVATLEILSPINKVAHSSGQRDFLRKRRQVMRSTAHWIEIDLLRAGARPLELRGSADYYAALHRAGAPRTLEVWTAMLREELPTIAVPLRAPAADVPLDLQEAVETVYARYRYDAGLDYAGPPALPPLSTGDLAWAEERITAWRQTREA
jgi:hypothetical protein